MNCVAEILEKAFQNNPDNIAISDESRKISYRELRNNALNIGDEINNISKKESGMVLIIVDRSVLSVIAIWGAVYSGKCYIPVDNNIPLDRLRLIIDSCEPELIICGDDNIELNNYFTTLDIKVISVKLLDFSKIERIINNFKIPKTISEDPLYMIYTSGSTGIPKGVIKFQRTVLDFIRDFVSVFKFKEEVFGNQASFDFDVAAKDIYVSAYTGSELCIMPRKCFLMPGFLCNYIIDHKITSLIWAASAVNYLYIGKSFEKKSPNTLKNIMFSGEALSPKVIKGLSELIPWCRFVNLYAPTEVTGNCMYYIFNKDDLIGDKLPLGVEFPSVKIMFLNEEGKDIKDGETGEIYVKGSYVSSGYYGREELTKKVYIQNPKHDKYIDIVFKTGDIVEKKENNYYFVSRCDNQFKHMGHRIESGDIEACVNSIEGINKCCVFLDDRMNKIVLFVETNNVEKQIIEQVIEKKLPKYMKPHVIVIKKTLPVNSRGKIDRLLIQKEYKSNE